MRNSRDTRFRKVEKLLYLYKDCAETSYKKLDKALEKIRNEKYYADEIVKEIIGENEK